MIRMGTGQVSPLCLAAMLVSACAAEGPPPRGGEESPDMAPIEALIANERAFAEASVATSTNEAFVAYIADTGVLFRPGPVDGPALLEAQGPSTGTLNWAPAFADLARSGDLGYTTGPWTFHREGEEAPVATGSYVTVWSLQDDGSFRFAIDGGTSYSTDRAFPADVMISDAFEGVSPGGADAPSMDEALRALEDRETVLAEASASAPYAEALAVVAAPSLRIHREGQPPWTLAAGPLEQLGETREAMSFERSGAAASNSGDLGYTYGVATFRGLDGTDRQGTYLRIWRCAPEAEWLVVLDLAVVNPASQ